MGNVVCRGTSSWGTEYATGHNDGEIDDDGDSWVVEVKTIWAWRAPQTTG